MNRFLTEDAPTRAPSLNQQIEEVLREIRLREQVYPRWVSTRKIRQGEADEHLRRMRGVLATLTQLRDGAGRKA